MLRQTVLVFLADGLSRVLLGAAGLLLIGFMAPAEYADYILATSLLSFVVQAASNSIAGASVVAYERFGLSARPLALLGVQFMGTVLLCAALLPLGGLRPSLHGLVTLCALAACGVDYAKASAQRGLRFGRYAALEILRSVSIAGALAAAAALRGSALRAVDVFALQAAGLLLTCGMQALAGRRSPTAGFGESPEAFRRIVGGPGRSLVGYLVLLAVYGQVDVWSLKAFRGTEALASYGSAQRYYLLLALALGSLQTVLLPTLKKAGTRDETREVFRKHRRLLLGFAPLVLLSALLAPRWVPFIDAGRYPEAVDIYRILAVSAVVSFAFSPHASLLLRLECFGFLFRLGAAMLAWHALASWAAASRGSPALLAAVHAVDYGLFNVLIFLRARRELRSTDALPTPGPGAVR